MPEGWAIASVQEVFQINPKNSSNEDADAGFVPMANISDGFSDCFTFEIRPWKTIKSGFTHFADNDVAVAKISPCLENRKSFVAKELPNGIGAGTTELFVFRSSQIVPEYTLLFFKSDYFISSCVGTFNGVVGQQRASRNVIEELVFPIPPKSEQYRIVQKVRTLFDDIDVIDNGKNAVEESVAMCKAKILELAIHGKLVPQDASEEPAIELLKRINPNYTPSHNLHYADRFPTGWAEFPLYAICEILDSQRKPVNSKEREKRVEKAKTLYPYYGATGQVGLIDNYILDGDYLLLGEDGAPFLDRYANKAYSVSGRIWVNNHAHILKPRINPTYMMYYLNAIQYRPYVTGTTRLKLTQEVMRNIPVLVPPLAEQARIISRVEQLFRVIDAIQLDK